MSDALEVKGAKIQGPVAIRGPFTFEPTGCPECPANAVHAHIYDHTMLVFDGMVDIGVVGQPLKRYTKGQTVVVEAGKDHYFAAIGGPATVYCMFSHRDFNGVVMERYDANVCDPDAYNFAPRSTEFPLPQRA